MDRDVIVRESLPFPFVNYAATFIGFHEGLGKPLHFCECQRYAIENHRKICFAEEARVAAAGKRGWSFDSVWDYPRFIRRQADGLGIPLHRALPLCMSFAPNLCHRCNLIAPRQTFVPVGGSGNFFRSYFGPYLRQSLLAAGLFPSGKIALVEGCPERLHQLTEPERLHVVENEVRESFGFPPLGVNRNHESLLHLLLRQLLPGRTIMRHHRPDWLGRLELDLFVEDLNIAFEFQGAQHSRPLDHLGGDVAFQALLRRDAKKAKLCKQQGVTLIEIKEGAPLTEQSVRQALRRIPSVKPSPPGEVSHPPFDFFLRSSVMSSRWTNYHERGELSVSIDLRDGSAFFSGKEVGVGITIEAGMITEITVTAGPPKSTGRLSVSFNKDDQPVVEFYRGGSSAIDLFLRWATFDPKIAIFERTSVM